ncbi:hypothetical protein AX14_014009 [Amanita brunnescens Koide BX004]|nr:hypothetical protein AX14_014009 [Amanita brunnescens Koide BX004]
MPSAEERRRSLMESDPHYQNIQQESSTKFGSIGVPIFTTFTSREDLRRQNVHIMRTAGISGTTTEGAYSIVLSSGYSDNVDEGDFISYTGTGGKEDDDFGHSTNLTGNQSFDHPHNKSLQMSQHTQRPVRVIRGPNKTSKYAPEVGYRYDGLYRVVKTYMTKGQNGFQVCKFDLIRIPGQSSLPMKKTS